MSSETSAPTAPSILGEALTAIRRCLLPGLGLWLLAGLAVLLYRLPATRWLYTDLQALRTEHGLLLSAISTALAAGVLPIVSQRLLGLRPTWTALALTTGFWALRGMELDLWYGLQARWFGEGDDLTTVLIKVAVDQFVYTPLWVTPVSTLFYRWRDGLPWRGSLRAMAGVLLANWVVWLPTVFCLYLLPTPVQMPVCTAVLAFWTLVLTLLATRPAAPASAG
jgi:hypothetical protein